ncbi:MAG: CoA ester lyase [Acidobacteriota bacterium]
MSAAGAGLSARSYLFAPGNDERLLGKVFDAGADAVVLDLEDAVPVAQKARARDLVVAALATRDTTAGPQVWVRINGLDSELWRHDVAALAELPLTGLRVPKAEDPQAVAGLAATLGESSAVRLTLTIESARGVLAAGELAAVERVDRFAFGAADYVADVGADGADPRATLWARSRLVAVSAAHRLLPPIAPAYTALADEAGLEATTREAKALGFFGRSCLHPRQLATVHRVFTPTAEEIAAARQVVAALEAARAAGRAVAVDASGRFLDPAVVRRAERVLALAEAFAAEPIPQGLVR